MTDPADAATPLSDRESQILRLLALGYSNKEIAAREKLSIKTVETYKSRAMEKLGLRNRVALIRYAIGAGWLLSADPPADTGGDPPDPPA